MPKSVNLPIRRSFNVSFTLELGPSQIHEATAPAVEVKVERALRAAGLLTSGLRVVESKTVHETDENR